MANIKKIKSKIKSVQNLKKITRALEVVSTVKLQKIKNKAENLKNYLLDLLFILENISSKIKGFDQKFDTDIKNDKKLIVVVSSDRGLCGAINTKLNRQVYNQYKEEKSNVDVFAIGKKGFEFFARAGFNVVGNVFLNDNFEEKDLLPVYEYIVDSLEQKKYSSIKIYFNYFKNTLAQIPSSFQIFPFNKTTFQDFVSQVDIKPKIVSNIGNKDIVIEPSLEELYEQIKKQIRKYLIFSAVIQNKAGEYASRMVAMKNAKDNCGNFIKNLTLNFNKARQASITQEISEIVSAKTALE